MDGADAGGRNPGADHPVRNLPADPDHGVGHPVLPRAQARPQGIGHPPTVDQPDRAAVQQLVNRAEGGGVGVVRMHDVHAPTIQHPIQPGVQKRVRRRSPRKRQQGQSLIAQQRRQLPVSGTGRQRLDVGGTRQRAGQIVDLPLSAPKLHPEIQQENAHTRLPFKKSLAGSASRRPTGSKRNANRAIFPNKHAACPPCSAATGTPAAPPSASRTSWGRGTRCGEEGSPSSERLPSPRFLTSAGVRNRGGRRTRLPSGPAPWDSCSGARRFRSRP